MFCKTRPYIQIIETASTSDLPTWDPLTSAEAKAPFRKSPLQAALASCPAAKRTGEVDQSQLILKVMEAEAGEAAAIDVTFDSTDGSFTAKGDQDEFGISTWKCGDPGGLVNSVLDLTNAKATEYKVSCGILETASINVMKVAVNNYIASSKWLNLGNGSASNQWLGLRVQLGAK